MTATYLAKIGIVHISSSFKSLEKGSMELIFADDVA